VTGTAESSVCKSTELKTEIWKTLISLFEFDCLQSLMLSNGISEQGGRTGQHGSSRARRREEGVIWNTRKSTNIPGQHISRIPATEKSLPVMADCSVQ